MPQTMIQAAMNERGIAARNPMPAIAAAGEITAERAVAVGVGRCTPSEPWELAEAASLQGVISSQAWINKTARTYAVQYHDEPTSLGTLRAVYVALYD